MEGHWENKIIPPQTYQLFYNLISNLPSEQVKLLDDIRNKILSNISQYSKMYGFRMPAQKVESIFLKETGHLSNRESAILKRALIAKLAVRLPALVEKMDLPQSIEAMYPKAFDRLAEFLTKTNNQLYDATGEFFCKDVRFVLGLMIPNGMVIFDMYSRFSVSSVIMSSLRDKSLSGIIKYFLAGGMGFWSQGHLDSRYLTEVSEKGFDDFFLRFAELLERKNNIRGYFGTSWLHDPQLPEISPRLAYWQKYPRKFGAFSLKHGSQQSDIAMAIKASETRKRLYKEGKYLPVCYSMLWPRKELIAWSNKIHTNPSN